MRKTIEVKGARENNLKNMNVKIPRGFSLKDERHEINFDPYTQRITFYSSDDTVDIERNPAKQWDKVDFRVANPGCTEVIYHVLGNTGSEVSESCSDTLEITGEASVGDGPRAFGNFITSGPGQ